jgi:hypothetical protein
MNLSEVLRSESAARYATDMTQSTPFRLLVPVDMDELAALLAVASEARQIVRKAREHRARHWTGRDGRLTLPIGVADAMAELVDGLDETQARLAKES